ncbi:hypothetical protein D3C74_213970 [compost metagenome]
MKFFRNKSSFLLYLLLSAFFLYSLWALVIPFNQAPDELQRYDVANFIFRFHELPIAGDERLIYGDYGVTYASYPYLPYILGAFLMMIFDSIFEINNLYLVHRLISIFSGVFSVFFVYKICEELKLEKQIIYFISALFAFLPGYSFVNGYVNQDSFSICVNLFVIYCWLIGNRDEWKPKNFFLLGLGISLCLLTYLNGYIVIPITMILLLLVYLRTAKRAAFFKQLMLFFILPIIIISGWWFLRSYILYDGDFIGLRHSKELSENLAIESLKPSNRQTMHTLGVSLKEMLIDYRWLEITFKSFLGIFGYMDRPLPHNVYIVAIPLLTLSLLGLVSLAKNFVGRLIKYKKEAENKLIYLLLFALIPLAFGLSIYYSYFSDFQAQGRYVYPALFPIILFFCLGLREVITERLRGAVYLCIAVAMFILNIYSVLRILLPSYY